MRIVAELADILLKERLSFRDTIYAICNLMMSVCYNYDVSDEHLKNILQKLLTDYCEENYEVEEDELD